MVVGLLSVSQLLGWAKLGVFGLVRCSGFSVFWFTLAPVSAVVGCGLLGSNSNCGLLGGLGGCWFVCPFGLTMVVSGLLVSVCTRNLLIEALVFTCLILDLLVGFDVGLEGLLFVGFVGGAFCGFFLVLGEGGGGGGSGFSFICAVIGAVVVSPLMSILVFVSGSLYIPVRQGLTPPLSSLTPLGGHVTF